MLKWLVIYEAADARALQRQWPASKWHGHLLLLTERWAGIYDLALDVGSQLNNNVHEGGLAHREVLDPSGILDSLILLATWKSLAEFRKLGTKKCRKWPQIGDLAVGLWA